jgi:hypothetical protein
VHVFFINQCNAQFLTIGFSSDYSTGRYSLHCKIEQVFRDRSRQLDGCKKDGLKLLSHLDLKRYRNTFPRKEDLQDEWEEAVTNLGKYVNLLVGQQTDEDQKAETDEENYYDNSLWEQKTMNYFMAYYQVKAQMRYFASRPDEAEHYKKFRVRTCV